MELGFIHTPMLRSGFQTLTSLLPSYYDWGNRTIKSQVFANTSLPRPLAYTNLTTTPSTQLLAAVEAIEYTNTTPSSAPSRNGYNNTAITHNLKYTYPSSTDTWALHSTNEPSSTL